MSGEFLYGYHKVELSNLVAQKKRQIGWRKSWDRLLNPEEIAVLLKAG